MQTIRFAAILLFVILAAGATIALAWGVAGDVMPVWQAALGPLLLAAMIALRLRAKKPPARTE
ncbi:MAG: hypothetical protein ACKVPY_06960 [Paracoccaceae bacterium]